MAGTRLPLLSAPCPPGQWQPCPPAGEKLFRQLHDLPDPEVRISMQNHGRITRMCLTTGMGQRCNILIPEPQKQPAPSTARSQDTESVPWDMEIAGYWCTHNLLKHSSQAYSIFSSSIINAIADSLADPALTLTLPGLQPVDIRWQGRSAVLNPGKDFDYQVGWSGSGLAPTTNGFMVLASRGLPQLLPGQMDHTLGNWQHWWGSYQKQWSATPLYWLTTLSANLVSSRVRNAIYTATITSIDKAFPAGSDSGSTPDHRLPATGLEPYAPHPLDTAEVLTKALIKGITASRNAAASTPEQNTAYIIPDIPPDSDTAIPDTVKSASTETFLYSLSHFPPRPFSTASFLSDPVDYSVWKQAYEALPNHCFFFARTIAMHLSGVQGLHEGYRSQSEMDYLSRNQPIPKPATLLLPGVPVQLHLKEFDLVLLLAIHPDQLLAAYKKDCGTSADCDLDNMEKARRHPGLFSLAEKLQEMNLRRFPFLVDQSWGSIDPQGQFKPAKKKGDSAEYYYTQHLKENEVILTHYSKQNIIGIIIPETVPLLSHHTGCSSSVITILKHKQEFEQKLGLKPLPLYFYNQALGRMIPPAQVTSDTELLSSLNHISEHADWFGCDPAILPAFFNAVPFSAYLKQLHTKASKVGAACFQTSNNSS